MSAVRYLKRLGPHRKLIAAALVSSLAASVLDGLTFSFLVPLLRVLLGEAPLDPTAPSAIYDFINTATAGLLDDQATLMAVLAVLVAVVALKNLAGYASSYLAVSVEEHVARDMRVEMHNSVIGLPVSYFERVSGGELSARMLADIDQARQLSRHVITTLFRNAAAVAVYLGLMLLISWQLTVAVVLAGPVIVLLVGPIVARMRGAVASSLSVRGGLAARHQEAVQGIRVLKSYGAEQRSRDQFRNQADQLLDSSLAAQRYAILASPVTEVLAFVAVAALVLLGTRGDGLRPELFMAFLALAVRSIAPLRSLSQLRAWAEQSLAAERRVIEVVKSVPEREGGLVSRAGLPMEVQFEGVSVHYGRSEAAVDAVDLTVRSGEYLAIVGESGSGKSTLLDLVPGFVTYEAGSVRIDGVPLDELDIGSVRRRIGYVGQDAFLFNASVTENIMFGSPGATPAEIAAAARAANAHSFVTGLPEGYETVLGERGSLLSGGQRQRVALARALLVEPDLLILDEATSSLDSESERAIRESLAELRASMTIMVVAHRLDSVVDADRVVVMRGGAIVEIGTPAELLSGSGDFHGLFARTGRETRTS